MSKFNNKPVDSIVVYERGGRVGPVGHMSSCVEKIHCFEIGAASAKEALAILSQEFGNARRFYVPNPQVIEKQPVGCYVPPYEKNRPHIRARSRQRRTSLVHGEHQLRRGEILQVY